MTNSAMQDVARPIIRRRLWKYSVGIVAAVLLVAWAVLGFNMLATPERDYSTTRSSEQALYRMTIIPANDPIPINEIHTWILHLETPTGEIIENAQIAVDGDMPEHGHGLPTRPAVTQYLGNGDYRVEGLKFQMTGWWVMDFDITVDGKTDRASFNLLLK